MLDCCYMFMGKKGNGKIYTTLVCAKCKKKCVLNSEPHLHRSPIPRSKRIDCVSEILHRKRLMNDRLSLLLLLAVVLFPSSLRCMSRISRIEKIMEITARTFIDQRNAVKLTIVPLILCCRLLWLLLNRATGEWGYCIVEDFTKIHSFSLLLEDKGIFVFWKIVRK